MESRALQATSLAVNRVINTCELQDVLEDDVARRRIYGTYEGPAELSTWRCMREPAISPLVATPETWTPSRRMQSAAAAEAERVERELTRLAGQEAVLVEELDAVRASIARLQTERDVLTRFADAGANGRSPGTEDRRLRVVSEDEPTAGEDSDATVLRGALIRETAVRVLAMKLGPDEPVHYRDWFALLEGQGFRLTGKDPLATFLTQLSRSPVVQRTTSPGMYVLDFEFPTKARARLQQLRAALRETAEQVPADVSVEEIAAAREQRVSLSAEVEATERALEEALRSLGDAAAS
jgi:hypothetical protein